MIKTYRKKPIEIVAVQWDGTNTKEIESFTLGNSRLVVSDDYAATKVLYIHTLEGDMYAHIGDYIIRGIKGEFYPCRESIFLKSYEES